MSKGRDSQRELSEKSTTEISRWNSRPAEGEFRQGMDLLPVAIYMTDAAGRLTYFNPACIEVSGRVPQLGSEHWCVIWKLYYPDGKPMPHSECPLAVALQGGPVISGAEILAERPDGTRIWVEHYPTLLTDAAGRIQGGINLLIDITRRKVAEESLAKKHQLYEGVLLTTPDLAYVFDLDHRFVYANAGLLKMWGKSWDEAIGKNCLELGYEPWHAAMHDREIDEVVATKQPIRGVVPFRGTFGRRLYDYIFTPVLNARGEVQAVAGTTRDVTDIKQTEQALRESEEQLAAELAGMTRLHELSMVLAQQDDLEEVMREVMEAAAELLGARCCTAQLLDPATESLRLVASKGFGPDFVKRFQVVSAQGCSTCAAAFRLRQRVILPDLTDSPEFDEFAALARPMEIAAVMSAPLLTDDGAILGVFTTYWHQPHAPSEHQLRLLDLYAQQAVRQVERRKSEEALRDADRRKDEFLATLAHELRNPLAPIRSGLEVMKLAKDDAHLMEEIRCTMVRQTDQLVRLIDDLMDVSRITRGKLKLQRQQVKMQEVLQSAIEATLPFIAEKGHWLTTDLPDQPMVVDVDPHRLTQVLSNLLQNAAKYSPEPGPIHLVVQGEGRDVVLSVRDRGAGIPADKLLEVFEMFAQIGRTAQHGYTGLGIGLTLARSFVEMHGGTIEARSEGVGRGAEFIVRLPNYLQNEKHELQAHPASIELTAAPKQRVLVLDDNQDAARMLSMAVEILGHEVRIAHDGVDALEVASLFEPHVVLLDLGMPRMDGYEAARQMRQAPWAKHAMLVALTGWGQEDDRRRTKAAGFDHHLVKPAEPAALKAIFAQR